MELDFIILGRIVIGIVSLIILGLLVKVRLSGRLGNEFFITMLIFWTSLLLIIIHPTILDPVLNDVGLENKAQFLLIISFAIILYLLVNQNRKGRNILTNFNNTIRSIALDNFCKEYKNEKQVTILILIAAKDEESTIGKIIQDVKKIDQKEMKILVVNDGSKDDTEKICRDNNVLVITHYQNLGVGGAIKTGYLASKLLNPEIIITIDADGQHDPKYIPDMIREIKNGADMVYGTRFAKDSNYETNSIRLVGNKFYSKLISKIGKVNLTDVTSGYRAIKFNRLSGIYFIAETNFAIELALRAAKNKLKIIEIPTEANPRIHGQSQLYRIEKFFLYNINAVVQIFNAYFKRPDFNSKD